MAISDSHAMPRMPATSPATSTSSSSVTGAANSHNHKGTTVRATSHRSDVSSEGKKWHYLHQQQQHSWTAGSTLSWSMRYADPWLHATTAAVAANGSGKYGTVRCHSSTSSHSNGRSNSQQQQQQHQHQRKAGTVRVTSTSTTNGGRGRPTVLLPSATDPYDLVRRSRLGRSVSPDTRSPDAALYNTTNRFMSAYATYGRRSILECDVNPYDLMDNNQDEQHVSSITCVNGQRIRVRPSLSNINYEHVNITTKQMNSFTKATNNNYLNLYNIRDANIINGTVIGSTNTGTTFKSILKKNSASNMDDNEMTTLSSVVNGTDGNNSIITDSSLTLTSRSPSRKANHRPSGNSVTTEHLINKNGTKRRISKSNTQFYIPMPANGLSCDDVVQNSPRKKVQFLMSPEKVTIDPEEYYNIAVLQQTTHNELYDEDDDDSSPIIEPTTQYHLLQRSISDRLNNQTVLSSAQTASTVVFHDSMALRSCGTTTTKQDARTVFSINSVCSSTDLERLDGVSKSSKSVRRPVAPPPQPPLPQMISTLPEQPAVTVQPDSNLSTTEEQQNGNGDSASNVVVVELTLSSSSSSPVVPPRKRSNNKPPPLENVIKISHRIQIRNELPPPEGGTNDNVNTINVSSPVTPLTTSILIGPDDHCYSTVNVNGGEYGEYYPHYRSSVVVPASYSSSKVYITGTSCTDEDAEDCAAVKHDVYEEICADADNNDDEEKQSYEEVGAAHQPKYEDIVYADNATQRDEITTELLQTILCDPVEAVRRNLVPHVCGKDMHTSADHQVICSSSRAKPPHINNNKQQQQQQQQPRVIAPKKEETSDGNIYTDGAYEALNGSTTSSAPSDCYTDCNSHSNRSSVTEDELHARNSKFYELLADASLAEVSSDLDLDLDLDLAYGNTSNNSNSPVKLPQNIEDNHHYESIVLPSQQMESSNNIEPIYEDIDFPGVAGPGAVPPPLPVHPPPSQLLDDLHVSAEYTTRSIFEGASKYDILSYLVDAKERGCVNETEDISEQEEDPYTTSSSGGGGGDVTTVTVTPPSAAIGHDTSNNIGDSDQPSLSSNLSIAPSTRSAEIERNDSGVGSETSKCSLSKYRNGGTTANGGSSTDNIKVAHNCDDCCDNDQENDNSEENGLVSAAGHFPDGDTADDTLLLQPLLCRRCAKRRVERREIIMEIVETEEKYMRDLQITLEEFYHPMLIAGLLTLDQLQAIFLNIEELLDNSTLLSDRLRDTVDIAIEQGDEDMLQVDIGRLFLDAGLQMLHAFEVYCIRQGGAALLLAGLEKEKELLRVFLRVSQMENVVLRRMNLSSFLMVPVQRVTKYPLLLARLYKVTPSHQEDSRVRLHEAQHTIELHLNHINSQTHNIPTKLWRRLNSTTSSSSSTVGGGGAGSISRQHSTTELIDLVGIKLRKIAVDALDWNHEEATFALEGRLLVTQPQVEGHHQWRKGRTIKLSPVCALLVTCGGGSHRRNKGHKKYSYGSYGSRLMSLGGRFSTTFSTNQDSLQQGQREREKLEGSEDAADQGGQSLVFPARHKNSTATNMNNNNGAVREAALLLLRDKGGRHSLLREPLYLDRCVVAADPAWQSYFEVQELHHTISPSLNLSGGGNLSGGSTHNNLSSSGFGGQNATYIFRAEDDAQTRMWYKQLQFYAQGMGTWRRRRNALPNIMIAGLGLR